MRFTGAAWSRFFLTFADDKLKPISQFRNIHIIFKLVHTQEWNIPVWFIGIWNKIQKGFPVYMSHMIFSLQFVAHIVDGCFFNAFICNMFCIFTFKKWVSTGRCHQVQSLDIHPLYVADQSVDQVCSHDRPVTVTNDVQFHTFFQHSGNQVIHNIGSGIGCIKGNFCILFHFCPQCPANSARWFFNKFICNICQTETGSVRNCGFFSQKHVFEFFK